MKILFIKYAAIGDVLNATPSIRALRQHYPDARIDCLVGKWSAPVLEHNKYVDSTIIFDEKIFSLKKIREMIAFALRLRKEKYDLTVCLHRSTMVHAWTRLIGAKRRIGFVNSKASGIFLTDWVVEDAYAASRQHETQYYNEVIEATGAKAGVAMDFFLSKPSESVLAFIADNLSGGHRPKIGVCAGGARNLVQTETRRQWFLESYCEMVRSMPDCDFVLFGADFDRYTVEAMRAAGIPNIIDAVGRFALAETAHLIGKCDAFITHDTGLMHVASAMDVPQVAIFGPTSPVRRAPLNKNAILLYTGEACSPCYQPTKNSFAPCEHVRCMHKLTPDMAVAALRKLVAGFPRGAIEGEGKTFGSRKEEA